MSSTHYFSYLSPVWDFYPESDRGRIAEMWEGYEQIMSAVYQKYSEVRLNASVDSLLTFSTERWLPYTFNTSNRVVGSARFVSTQDMSRGILLSGRTLLRFRIDGTTTFEVDIASTTPSPLVFLTDVVEKINDAAGFRFAGTAFQGTVLALTSPTVGISSSIEFLETSVPADNACEFILGIDPGQLPYKYPEFPFTYSLPATYGVIRSIPELQNAVLSDKVTETLVEGTDYIITYRDRRIAFKQEPQESYRAVRTYIDEQDGWNNFGYYLDIYDPNSDAYVEAIQGLWYAVWTGSTPDNIVSSLYLLFGLPTAPADGTIGTVTTTQITFIGLDGRATVFDIPDELVSIVEEGESVTRFQPLTDGISIFDKISAPGFVEREIGRAGIQRFLTEQATTGPGDDTDETRALRLLEEHTFLPQISVNAFISDNISLSNVRTFLDTISPLQKTYFFQVIVGVFRDQLPIGINVGLEWEFNITPTLDSNQTTWLEESTLLDYETDDYPGLDLDPHVIGFGDTIEVEVRSFGSLIDVFEY